MKPDEFQPLTISLVPLSDPLAQAILTWRYPAPYDLYNMKRRDLKALLDPRHRYHALITPDEALIGFCCFGFQATVPGGRYLQNEPEMIDLGIGLHPQMLGRRLSRSVLPDILAYAQSAYEAQGLRVTIAAFNERSRRAFGRQGFVETFAFFSHRHDLFFFQYERHA